MMALHYETAPASAITWIKCLGDLACSQMAIDDVAHYVPATSQVAYPMNGSPL
jgi:hypothetical protein